MKRLRLPARMEHLDRLMRFISEFAEEHDFSLDRIREIELAAEEALVNIIHYAYPEGEGGDVEILCSAGSEADLKIELRDWGIPFDMTQAADPDTDIPLSERKIGGLGVLLIRKMVNEVIHRREGDRNILTFILRKKRDDRC